MRADQARRAGVLGHPIEHSLSPALHRAAYSELGLDWDYAAYDVVEGGLAAFLADVDDTWVGLSLTMPLKHVAAASMDFVEPLAKLLGVVNTVIVDAGGSSTSLIGANTDVYGVRAALAEAGVDRVSTGVVLGGGATATSAVAALAELGCHRPVVALRDRTRAGGLMRAASKMGIEPRFVDIVSEAAAELALADAAVSTIPAAAAAPVGSQLASARGVLVDAVYDPIETDLTAGWSAAGGTVVPGTRMLLHQAAEQVRLWTGGPAPLAAMEAALVANLSQR